MIPAMEILARLTCTTFFEFHYIIDGFIKTKVGNVERTYGPGQFYVMTPLSIHSHTCCEEPNNYCISFALRWEWQRLKSDDTNPELDSIKYSLDSAQSQIMEDYHESIAKKLNSIINLALQDSSRSELLLHLAGLIVFIGSRYVSVKGTERQLPAMPKAAETILKHSIEYIEHHYSETISPSDVAASIPISYSHLARLFSQYMNSSVSHYITCVKMDKATHLLLTTDMDINDVAQATGFSSLSYFSYTFKNLLGLAPRDFRVYWRGRYFKGDSAVL